jgi:hypothetical protein
MMETLLSLIIIATPQAAADTSPTNTEIRAAVEKALPLIQQSIEKYPEHRDCFSCHHQAVPVLALTTARDQGFAVNEDAITDPVELTEADLRTAIESYKKGTGQGGGVTRAGYALLTLERGGKKPDDITDAVTSFLLKYEDVKDHWRGASNRPPSEASEFTATYLAIRGLTTYGAEASKAKIAERIANAKTWLTDTKPKDTEDRVFRLLALKAAAAEAATIRKAADELIATQQDDGGWPQLDKGTSDAYATGSTLAALYMTSTLSTDDPTSQKALQYLIRSQKPDGTWFVHSRSKPFQPYFESGFPYAKDQFISMAATAWATTALATASQKTK